MENEFLGKHVVAFSARNFNQSLKDGVPAGHNPQSFLSALCLEPCHRIELPILKEGEGLLLPDNHGRKIGSDCLIKIGFQLALLLFGELLKVNDVDTRRFQLSHQLLIDFFSL